MNAPAGRVRRFGAAVVAAAALAVLPAGSALADAAGPTDYATTIVDVSPDVSTAVRFSVEGSDAFIRAIVEPGHELVVLGYDGEAYIRIDGDGVVAENHNSETYYYNRERFGGDIPADADSSAEPDWVVVDDDGEHAWHDHRAHWMAENPLIGMRAGDSFPPDQIDVIVDGVPTTITVVTTLRRGASMWWLAGGLAIAGVVGVVAARGPRSRLWLVGLAAAGAAIVFGVAQYVAVPASTGPSLVWWALPVVAAATFAAAGSIGRRSPGPALILCAAGGVELLIWAIQRAEGLLAAYRPTVLAFGADRLATVAVGVIGIGIVVAAATFGWQRRATSASG